MKGHLAKVCNRANKGQFNNHCVEVEQHAEILPTNDDYRQGGNVCTDDEDLRIFSMEVDRINKNVVMSTKKNLC